MLDVAPSTIAVYGDIACPWSHVATYRLCEARSRLGLVDAVIFDMRAFPLELVNGRPTPKDVLDAEIPVAGALAPKAGWQMWSAPTWTWPVTTLPALEAVQAAKLQHLRFGEDLARLLRRALFAESRCVSMRHVVFEIAGDVDGLDLDRLTHDLDAGAGRRAVLEHLAHATDGSVKLSPHVFTADGTSMPNPGIELHWEGEHGRGFPVVDDDDPSVYDRLLRLAAGDGGGEPVRSR